MIDALRTKPHLCRHQISELTGLPQNLQRNALQALQHSKTILRVMGVDATDKVYALADQSLILPQNPEGNRLPTLFGLDEGTARDRVFMLKRMRERLIDYWHPVLDKVIGDYVSALKAVEEMREPPDTEFDF